MEMKMEALAPQRSRTDPEQQKRERTRRSRLHAGSLRSKGQHEYRQHRRHAKDVVQSAIETRPPISFDTLLRRDKRSPSPSKHKHRSSSDVQQHNEVQQPVPVVEPVTVQDVEKMQKDNARREEELRQSLKNVEDVGMSSTRQLDDTYYAILEKASILRSTVQSLQRLAEESRRLHSTFDEDTTKLKDDTQRNLDAFGNFEQQEGTINELVTRLTDSRTQTNKLNERLESARHRVEAFEKREGEKAAARRTRWHMIWVTLLSVVLLVIAIVVTKHRRVVAEQLHEVGNRLGDVVDGK